jgi:uncharacterized protein YbjT (DUF2867 family)
MSEGGKKAVILGATGLVGSALLEQLLNHPDYTTVRALVRKPTGVSHSKLEEHIINFKNFQDYTPLFEADEVFCCLGTTMKQAGSKQAFYFADHDLPVQAAKMAQLFAKKFFLVSSIGANAWSLNYYLKVKGETERDILQTTLESIYIVRPSMLLGNRKEQRKGEEIGKSLLKIFKPFMIGDLRKYRGIEAGTVARAMILLAERNEKGKFIFESQDLVNLVRNQTSKAPIIPQL